MNSIIKDYFKSKQLTREKLASSTLSNPADTNKTLTSKLVSNNAVKINNNDLKNKTDNNEEDSDYPKVSIGINGLLAASKKLLAINKGEAEPDNRDSLRFKRVLNVDDLIAERAALDAGKLKNNIMYKISKSRSLKHFPSNVFDPYVTGHIVGNPLSLPSEEINPLYLLDQQSRLTVFGQGGIKSADLVTPEAQNVNPSTFGFIDPIASPDGLKIGVDTRLAYNTRIGNNGKLYTRVRNKRTGKLQWLTPDELEEVTVAFPD